MKERLLVIIESPYAGDVEANVAYARRCLKDSLSRGEAPLASHLLYTQVLDDTIPEERQAGIEAGLSWMAFADKVVAYTDRGMSRGVTAALAYAVDHGYPVEYRRLDGPPPVQR